VHIDAGTPTRRIAKCEAATDYLNRVAHGPARELRGFSELTEEDIALHMETRWENPKKKWPGLEDVTKGETLHYQGACEAIPMGVPVTYEIVMPKEWGNAGPYDCCDLGPSSVGCYFDYKLQSLSVSH